MYLTTVSTRSCGDVQSAGVACCGDHDVRHSLVNGYSRQVWARARSVRQNPKDIKHEPALAPLSHGSEPRVHVPEHHRGNAHCADIDRTGALAEKFSADDEIDHALGRKSNHV